MERLSGIIFAGHTASSQTVLEPLARLFVQLRMFLKKDPMTDESSRDIISALTAEDPGGWKGVSVHSLTDIGSPERKV